MKDIIVIDASANNLKSLNVKIEYGKLIVCAGPSGSGKSSFAFNTLVNKESCNIENYPSNVISVSQRICSTKQKMNEIFKLSDVTNSLVVIDEPLAGMTLEEAHKASAFIKRISSNNYVVVVEHRREIFSYADIVLEFGPESGVNGGQLINITSGYEYLINHSYVNADRIGNKSNKKISALFSEYDGLKNYKVEIYLNTITSITGSAGSGKSTYLEAIYNAFDKSAGANERRKNLVEVKNKSCIRRPHIIDATPVSKNSRSTVATYYGVSKFFKENDLDLTIREAMDIHSNNKLLIRRLVHLSDIGLDYLKLNQNSYTLSGGECQRIKLAKLLCKKLGDRSIYIFDNPVRGLGENNITKVMMMFDKLVKMNNTVIIAENDPTALLLVDNIIELKNGSKSKIGNKLESIDFINSNHLNKFAEDLFHNGEEERVLDFIKNNSAKYYAIRDKSHSGGIFKLGVLKEDILDEIKTYDIFTINVSSLNYGDNQILVGEIIIKSNHEVWATLSNKKGASVRDALSAPTYNIKTNIFDKSLNNIEGFDKIYDYIARNDLKDYIVEFALFDIPVGIKNDNIIIYEIRTDY